MLMNRWEPWTQLNRISREMDQLFGRRGSMRGAMGVGTFPALNLWEAGDELFVEAELPGLNMEQLEIYMTGNQLSITGERQLPPHEQGVWHRQEREYGKFTRTIELPVEVNADAVSAELKHGVLLIRLPKSDAIKPRKIEVKAS
jgi:HSP20 family protein